MAPRVALDLEKLVEPALCTLPVQSQPQEKFKRGGFPQTSQVCVNRQKPKEISFTIRLGGIAAIWGACLHHGLQ